MPLESGTEVVVDVVRPVAGGWMLARHEGQVVLVRGAIPGERVRARIDRAAKGALYAATADVIVASPDRRDPIGDVQCGGNLFAHIAYERQRRLKGEIIHDALTRIGRLPWPDVPEVLGSPEHGYRMRARLHARNGRLGFFVEGTHRLCEAAGTRQLLSATAAWIEDAERIISGKGLTGLAEVEIAENIAADQRACHLLLEAGVEARRFGVLAESAGLTGLSAERADRRGVEQLAGVPSVTDVVHARAGDPAAALRLRRDVRAFFQGNRFLLEPLVRHVIALVPPEPVVDLYAGVGLFGLSLAAAGFERVTLVEGDPVSGASLEDNAAPFRSRVTVERRSVEAFVRTCAPRAGAHSGTAAADATFIVDPPRSGMSKEALAGLVLSRPARLIYVSCDVATFARDTRTLLESGYRLEALTGIDLFPNTAHVETVAAYTRVT